MRKRRQLATASVEKIFLLAPGTFRRGIMLVNFTDQGLKDVKDVPNNEGAAQHIMAVQHLFVFWTLLGLRGISQRVKGSRVGGMANNKELDPETADLVSAAFAKSWRFVSTDPQLGHDDTDAMRIRLSRHLESLAKYG